MGLLSPLYPEQVIAETVTAHKVKRSNPKPAMARNEAGKELVVHSLLGFMRSLCSRILCDLGLWPA